MLCTLQQSLIPTHTAKQTGCWGIPGGRVSGRSVFPRFSGTHLFSRKVNHTTFTGQPPGQERARVKSHGLSGNHIFLQTETTHSHIKYFFTVTQVMSDRTLVFAIKTNTNQWRLPIFFSPKAHFQDYQNSAGSVHLSGLTKQCSWAKDMSIYPTLICTAWDLLVFITGVVGTESKSSPTNDWISCFQIRQEIPRGFSELDVNTCCQLKYGHAAAVRIIIRNFKIFRASEIGLTHFNLWDSK